MMRKEQAVLAAALVLIMLVASSLGQLAEAQHYDVLNITLCLTQALFFDNHGGNLTMIHPPLVAAAASLLTAARDINNLDCSVIGIGCKDVVSYPGGRIGIRPVVVDVRSYEATNAQLGMLTCSNNFQSDAVIGMLSARMLEASSLLAYHYKIPIITNDAMSPSVSNTRVYPFVARTIHSASVEARAALALFKHLGFRQSCVLHQADTAGLGYADAFLTAAREFEIDTASFSVGLDPTQESIQRSVAALGASSYRAVVVFLYTQDAVSFTQAVADGYLGQRSAKDMILTWHLAGGMEPILDAVWSEENVTRCAAMLDVLEGSVSWVRKIASMDKYNAMVNQIQSSFDAADLSTSLHDPEGIPDPRLAAGVAQAGTGRFESWPGIENGYDAVWAAASAFAKAAASMKSDPNAPENRKELRSLAYKALVTPGEIDFSGASGRVLFNDHGGRLDDSVAVEFQNFAGLPGSSEATVQVVGCWSDVDGVRLNSSSPIRFANGMVYPEVPSDGSSLSSKALLLTSSICGTIVTLLLLVTCYVSNKAWKLRMRVSVLETSQELDMHSPLAKVLDFLKRYSKGIQIGSFVHGPSKQEASELISLVIRSSHNLALPDIQNQLEQSPELASDITRYMASIYTKRDGNQASWNSRLSFNFARQSFSLARHPSRMSLDFSSSPSDDIQAHKRQAIIDHYWDDYDARATQLPKPDNLNPRVRAALCTDYFFDFLTTSSPIHGCQSPLAAVARQGIHVLNLEKVLHASAEDSLVRFAAAVESGYPSDLYHSKNHAADVSNRMASLLLKTGIASNSSRSNAVLMLSALVAAFIHDYEHPQVNNHFLVDQEAKMADEFNDQSVSENHSIRSGLHLIKENEALNFLTKWKKPDKKTFRESTIGIVLATDMARHFELLSQFQLTIVENPEFEGMTSQAKWMAMDYSKKSLTLKVAMKVCDLGHCSLPIKQHREWIDLLEQEFFAQGDREREAGAKVSFLMDRSKPGVNNGKNQVSFFNLIALPLFRAWCKTFPECMSLQTQAEANVKYWEAVAARKWGEQTKVE